MSRRDRRSGSSKCCLTCLIVFLLVIVLLVATVVVVLNMTPNNMGLGDIEITNGKTFNDYGLGDIKFIDIIKEIYSLKDVQESDVVKNGYNEETESSNASTALSNSNFTGENYTSLVENKVEYDNQYVIEYNDKTIAYIFNKIITDGVDTNDTFKELKELNVEIRELTIYENADHTYNIRIVVKFNVQYVVDQMASVNAAALLPEGIYLVYNAPVTANAEGELVIGDGTFTVNGDENTPLFAGLLNIVNDLYSLNTLASNVADGVEMVVGNLGKVGTATANEEHVAVESTIVYGSSGIAAHKITIITYVQALPEP